MTAPRSARSRTKGPWRPLGARGQRASRPHPGDKTLAAERASWPQSHAKSRSSKGSRLSWHRSGIIAIPVPTRAVLLSRISAMRIAICAIRAGAAERGPVRCRLDARARTESGCASFRAASVAATVAAYAVASDRTDPVCGTVDPQRWHGFFAAGFANALRRRVVSASRNAVGVPIRRLLCCRCTRWRARGRRRLVSESCAKCRRCTHPDPLVSPLYRRCTRCQAHPAPTCLGITRCSRRTHPDTLVSPVRPLSSARQNTTRARWTCACALLSARMRQTTHRPQMQTSK